MREPDYTKIGCQIDNRFQEGLPNESARDYSPRGSIIRNSEPNRPWARIASSAPSANSQFLFNELLAESALEAARHQGLSLELAMSEWKDKTALVTGASYGIGEAFARRLAADGANVIITARSRDRLYSLADELRSRYGANVTVIEADLARPSTPEEIFRMTEGSGVQIDLLVNNAGFGAVGDFADLPLARQLEMIQVNVTALVALSHLFLQAMSGRRAGAIIQVASTASFQGVPYSSIYSATKAFILNFSEGLWAECREYGVRVLALCPGPTATHFQTVAGTAHLRDPQKMQTSEEVVEAGLKALAQNRSVAISGFNNKLMVWAERLVSRNFATRMAAKLFRPFSTRSNQYRER